MGFSVLGPVMPNVISIDYGVNLAGKLKSACNDIPIIGSVLDLGSKEEIVSTVTKLCKVGVDGIEFNISCPNVITMGIKECAQIRDILSQIRKKCSIPISLKISPQKDYSGLLPTVVDIIDGLTLSNAYIGLVPPNTEGMSVSPFKRRNEWAPSGVYGPFERLLTFNTIFSFHNLVEKNKLSIACVGGITSVQDAIQALMLDADVVQLSSAILWHGVSIFNEYNNLLLRYINEKGVNSVNQLKGLALQYIKDNSSDLPEPRKRTMSIDDKKCKKCQKCKCCDRLCIAIHQDDRDHSVSINKELCSGCGMCMELCPNSAILECAYELSVRI